MNTEILLGDRLSRQLRLQSIMQDVAEEQQRDMRDANMYHQQAINVTAARKETCDKQIAANSRFHEATTVKLQMEIIQRQAKLIKRQLELEKRQESIKRGEDEKVQEIASSQSLLESLLEEVIDLQKQIVLLNQDLKRTLECSDLKSVWFEGVKCKHFQKQFLLWFK